MVSLQAAVSELVELIGEELATDLVADLVDGIKSKRRPFDEVARFMMADAQERGDQESVEQARFASVWSRPIQTDAGGPEAVTRLSRVDLFLGLYRQASDKEAVAKLAEQQLSRTSYWRFCREAGIRGQAEG